MRDAGFGIRDAGCGIRDSRIRDKGLGILLLLLLSAVAPATQQQQQQQQPSGSAVFALFIGGREVGREQVNLARSGSDWIITATGRHAAPADLAINRFEMRYTADWQPIELKIEARQRNQALGLATSFGLTAAINEITQNGVTNSKTDQVSARTVVLPNNFYAAYEALAARLASAAPGTDLPVYVAPQAEIRLSVRSVTPGQIQTPGGVVRTRRYAVTFHNPGGPLEAEITIDDRNRFARLEIAAATLLVTRQDLAGVATRSQTVRNATDTDVRIPAAGFSLAATVTTPPVAAGELRYPAVVLVAGSGPVDRDATVAGIPIFAQLAGQLAERGFVVVRYDKRGVGQSGGRTERVTLRDYADDAIAVVKWTEKRKDVEKRRIALVGHSEGASVGMLAAEREKKIATLVLMAGMGTTGQELILEQQQSMLEATRVPEGERAAKVDLQKRILAAVIAEKGWETIPAELRAIVDNPWYRSLLLFDPAREISKVKQPVLILQGALDTQVRPHHADRLAELARARKKAPPVEVVHLPGLNHLFVPAATGEVSEYGSLKEKAISPEVARTIADWLNGLPGR
jgi:hypothetical protein